LVYGKFKKANYVSISKNQRKPMPNLNFTGNVYNGIEVNKFPFSEKVGNYLAFLGRMSPEKGPLQAIEVAKMAGLKLKMAAKVDVVDKDFFEGIIKPLIDNKQIEFIGEIGHKEKAEFLNNALALLAPIQWEEPFGLYFIEAMACGTPVISFNRGSVPEIIENGKTGFIVNSTKEMASAIKDLDKINRIDCRKHVEGHFTVEKMAEGYINVYKKILGKK
jgi:glycosyltransferase involved in cell wall biosynthesis